MNKIYTIAFMLLTGFVACEGPTGPPGPPGPRGPQGEDGLNAETPYLFEYVIAFEEPDYSVPLPFPDDFPTYESDVVLVYLLWNVQVIDGEEVDIWRLMPQSQMMEFGWLQYNFDFTLNDVVVFMESDFPLSQLGPDYTEAVVRVVVVPALPNGRVNFNNYHEVQKALGLPEKDLPKGYTLPGRR